MVSVIIPNYNHAPYLRKRIDSVLNQTYQDYELIILDDNSTDNSKEIIEQYRDNSKISKIVYNKENSGSTFRQWKKGIELAKGEYIWIAESDDWAENTFLDKNIDLIKKYNAILSFSLSTIVDNEGNPLYMKDEVIPGSNHLDSNTFLRKYLLYSNLIYNASMVVFRKDSINNEIWKELQGYKYCGDWAFWTSIMENTKGNIVEIKDSLNFFRTHVGNVSNRSEKLGLTIKEGFLISRGIFVFLNLKNRKNFQQIWCDMWLTYRTQYRFSKIIDFSILFYFLKNSPPIAFSFLKHRLLRLS